MGAFSLTKSERLLRRSDFERLSKQGDRMNGEYFIVLYSQNDLGRSRLGVTVSKRVGCAVIRNRVKRLAREYFRRHKTFSGHSYDISIIAKRGASHLSSRQTQRALEAVVRDILRDCKHEAVFAGTH